MPGVDTNRPNTIPPDTIEPSQPPRRRRLRRFFLVPLLLPVAVVIGAMGASPEFHRVRLPVGGPLEGQDPAAAALAAEQDARRLVTEISAVHAASGRVGRWEGFITERQLNAWLAIDLPRNHPSLMAGWGTDARVELLPSRVRIGCRLGRWPLSTVAWIEAEVQLRTVNQLGITIINARLGSLPVPRGPILKELARRIAGLGAVTDIRRFGDRSVLLVSLPSTAPDGMGRWLESLLFASGELAFAGETRPGVPPR
jgi:hypothetical protein